jgi:hypothetical protein
LKIGDRQNRPNWRNDFNDLPFTIYHLRFDEIQNENGLMDITNRRLLQFCRWLLILVCFSGGGFLLLGGKSKGFGILLLLIGLWFVLDNPLDSFENSRTISNLDPGSREGSEEDASQVEPVLIKPGDSLDLHVFSPKEVPSLLDEFLHLSQKADIRLVNIIHGKGTGALRRRVHSLLARDSRVVTFYHAPRKSGDWGATIVELRPATDKNNRRSSG